MPYHFATENQDYSDYASGRFFYAAPGHPVLPVRLSSEIFQRCLAHFPENGRSTPITLYDPTCGSAYHLSTLAYLHWKAIDTIIASDIDPEILSVAERNLSLLTKAGNNKRTIEISSMIDRFGKPSHKAALESAHHFSIRLDNYIKHHEIRTKLFKADATNNSELNSHLTRHQIDLVIADVPYGRHATWHYHQESSSKDPLSQMLAVLLPFLSPASIVAIIHNKGQTFSKNSYQQVEKFQIGKRRIVLLRKHTPKF